MHFGAVEDGYKRYLTTFNQWYKEGLIDQGFSDAGPRSGERKDDQWPGRRFHGEWAGSRMGTWITAAQKTDPNYMLVAAPIRRWKRVQSREMGQIDNRYPNQGCVAITTSCKNVELAARLLDYAYSRGRPYAFQLSVLKGNPIP